MKQNLLGVLLIVCALRALACEEMIISVPVAGLRTKPEAFDPLRVYDREYLSRSAIFGRFADLALQLPPAFRDPILDTQMLYGEHVKCLSRENGWLFVELLEQIDVDVEGRPVAIKGYIQEHEAVALSFQPACVVLKNNWVPIYAQQELSTVLFKLPLGVALPGERVSGEVIRVMLVNGRAAFVRSSDCYTYSTQLLICAQVMRARIVEEANHMVGMPYCWGGRSPFDEAGLYAQTSVDCSSLINLIFRASGYDMRVRNSRSQFNACTKKQHGSQLKPGDCVFFASCDNPTRVIHVMLYVGNNELIDATFSHKGVARTNALERFGTQLEHLSAGQRAGDFVFYFGSFLG